MTQEPSSEPRRTESELELSALPADVQAYIASARRDERVYPRDGTIFHNRERLLPTARADYYREYTVPTPGAPDRGGQRVVIGAGGEVYYTSDHYSSFARIT